jgi:hypothetical protein
MMQNVMVQFEFRREPNATLRQKIKNVRPPNIMHGFFCFNILNAVRLDQMIVDCINPEQNIVYPQKLAEFHKELDALDHYSTWRIVPYNLMAIIAVPNGQKAIQTYARNQSKVNQAQIVCALERHRLSHGAYPKTLKELDPQFIDKLPHDIIGGQPLKYRLSPDGQFTLYSLGWDEKDDNGVSSCLPDGEGDWCWE